MAVDLSKIAAPEQARLARVGGDFSTEQVQAQGGKTRAAFALHGAKVLEYGYVAADDVLLAELLAMGEGRPTEQGATREARKGLTTAQRGRERQGKSLRQRMRATLKASADRVALRGGEEEVEAARSVYQATSSSGADAGLLATQLELLAGALEAGVVGQEAAGRGAAAQVAEAKVLAAALREGVRALGGREVEAHDAARFQVIEGLAIELMRSARAAARAAARESGDQALAAAFDLDALYS